MAKKSKRKHPDAMNAGPQGKEPSQRVAPPGAGPSLALVALLVFASGCAALVFQVTWMRELRLVFGATTAAVSAVLAVFMGGLGLGSAVLGKAADRSPRPLRMYGRLEIGVSLAAAASPLLLWACEQAYLSLGGQSALGTLGATLVRLLIAVLVMGVPAFLMGGTLPAASRSVTRAGDVHRTALAVLYGVNTLGAVCGAAASTFFALERLGAHATLWAGCVASGAAGLAALRVAAAQPPTPVEPEPDAHDPTPAEPDAVPTDRPAAADRSAAAPAGLVYLTAALAGFTFFALEIVWYRMLAPILGGTTFTFGTILGVALLGIGLGGLLYNLAFSRLIRPTLGALALTCGLEAVFVGAPYAMGDRLAVLAARLAHDAQSFAGLAVGWVVVTSIVVLGAALVSGLQFPLLIALLGRGRGAVSRHVGAAYAWNTFGAIAGSLVAGFGALPLLTAPGMWVAIGVALSVLSLVLVVFDRPGGVLSKAVVFALGVATAVLVMFPGPTAGWRHSGIGAGRAKFPSFEPNAVRFLLAENRRGLVWEADGLEASVGIRDFDGYEFVVNGKVDGNSLTDAPTQVGVALLGAVLCESPKTAMVIGLGTGESVGWLAEMRGVERVDAIELEPALDKMVELCAPVNFDALRNPKVRRIYNDGREAVLTSSEQYDVIVSEPSNPYRAGVATLYTSEFYQAASRRLNKGGVFVQFLQAYEVDDQTVATVLATVRSAFKHVEVWQTLPVDLQLVCSNEPLNYTADDLRERIESPTIKRAIRRVWMTSGVEGFLSHFTANSDWVDHVAGLPTAVLNTDDRTVLEYRFAKTVGQDSGFSVPGARALLAREGWHRPHLEDDSIDWGRVELKRQVTNLIQNGPLSHALLPRIEDKQLIAALNLYRGGAFDKALATWPEEHRSPDDDVLTLVLAHCRAEMSQSDCLTLLAPLAEERPADVHAVRTIYYSQAGQNDEGRESFAAMLAALRREPWGILHLFQSAVDRSIGLAQGEPDAAQEIFRLLEKPMVCHRLEYMRRIGRVLVAIQAKSPQLVVEAFTPLEPHPPWRIDLLKARAEAYRATNHPLAGQAEADVREFQSQAGS